MASTSIAPSDRERLIKLAGMFGSAYPAERAVAAKKATQLLEAAGLSWAGLLSAALVAETHRYLTRPETRRAAAKMGASL